MRDLAGAHPSSEQICLPGLKNSPKPLADRR
jgi:hypothetical protein